jgi:lipoprotein-anchoring transpeptidase ErfK/SrfK
MRPLTLLPFLAVALAACGTHRAAPTVAPVDAQHVLAARVSRCTAGELLPMGSSRVAYAAEAPHGAVAVRRPNGAVVARFGRVNVNDYPTVFSVLGAVVHRNCTPAWYRVQIPVKPNGATAFVRASTVQLEPVTTRIVVSISRRRLVLYRSGRVVLRATVAVGSPSTPTPTGRYYVNQRLVPTDTGGPFGPGALGISAFSNVLTGWTQGGPIAIHGTDEPWSIGHDVSNGCIRLPNATLLRVFKVAVAGTPVIITA